MVVPGPHNGQVGSVPGVLLLPLSLVFVGLLVLLLRWTYARGGSVVAPGPRIGHSDEYGLLVPVAEPATYIEGELVRQTLEAAGVRAMLTMTLEGPRVMVFPDDEKHARQLLA